jgi:hypothetical protein
MTSSEFIIWFKGFTAACNDYTATPKQWDHIKQVLNEVQDYDDNPGIDVEIDNYKDWFNRSPITIPVTPLTGTLSGSGNIFITSGSNGTTTGTFVWNDKMGNWHYTNSTADTKIEKQQLND